VWDSLVKRRVEAESWEKEAREKDLSLAEVEERRIRGNRRRSRRSRGADLAEQKYKVDNPSALLWTGKYQPRCGADLVGNCESIKQLRTWLSSWLGASHGRRGSSSTTDLNTTASTSDTGSEWGSGSDGQEPDVERTAALITGPSGSGKTAAVFALAAELGFNVLEVNASSGRNGKAMLARLHEATQSQQVRREQGQVKEEGSSKKKALILFEDIDLVFDDLDDGFYGAVTTLVQQTKRPIVLTTSDQGFKILGHRALRCDPELIMWEAPDTREVASHLQALALVEGFSLSSHHLAKMVKVSSSMRQAVLQMQLYCQGNAVEEEDVISSEEEIEDEEKGNVSKAPQPDIKKWFKQLEGRARRAGKASRGRALPQPPLTHANSYCHRTWWGRLPHVERKEREAKYPLTALVQTRHRIDPLKCKDLFDDEVSEEEMEVEASKELGKESTKLTREERKTNLAALEGMARHLDILSLEGEEGSALALSATLPLSSQVARVTMWTEGDRGRLAQEEVLESELVANREVMGWREACELVSGVRGIARLEEERRVETIGSGRRGASARFNHYFSHHCDVTLDDHTLAALCNTFC